MGVATESVTMMLRVALLCVVGASLALAQDAPVGGENMGIPVASLPIPFDKCSAPATNDADMRMTVFAWGYDNEFWTCKQDASYGAMSEWKSVGGFFAGGPTVIRNANNDVVAFGRGADKKIWYKVFHPDATEDDWTPLGGKTLSARITAVADPQGLIHLFGR